MRTAFFILPLLILPALAGCGLVGNDTWVGMDYAQAACGTREAILTTTGCITSPPVTAVADNNKPVSNPDDVNNSHNAGHSR